MPAEQECTILSKTQIFQGVLPEKRKKWKGLPPLLNPCNMFQDPLLEMLKLGVKLQGTGRQAFERTDTTEFTWRTAITSCFRFFSPQKFNNLV